MESSESGRAEPRKPRMNSLHVLIHPEVLSTMSTSASPARPGTALRGHDFNPRLTSTGVPLVPGEPIVRSRELPRLGGCCTLAGPAASRRCRRSLVTTSCVKLVCQFPIFGIFLISSWQKLARDHRATAAPRGWHRPLHPAGSAPHGDHAGDAAKGGQVGYRRILRNQPQRNGADPWPSPSGLAAKRGRGAGEETVRRHGFRGIESV